MTMEVDVFGGLELLRRPVHRYRLLCTQGRSATRLGLRVYAFGFSEQHLRLLVGGSGLGVASLGRALKVASSNTARSLGLRWRSDSTWSRCWYGTVLEGAAWVHRATHHVGRHDALASPWCSHRDALGLRRAAFFDPVPLRRSVDLVRLHQAVSHGPIPFPPLEMPSRCGVQLPALRRVAAAVTGVLPADRRSVVPFAQAAVACGVSRQDVGDWLGVGPRQVRHYLARPCHGLEPTLTSLTDPRLLLVP